MFSGFPQTQHGHHFQRERGERNKKRVWYTPTTSMSAQPTDQNQAYATCNTAERTSCANAAAAAAVSAAADPEEGDEGGGGGGGCVR